MKHFKTFESFVNENKLTEAFGFETPENVNIAELQKLAKPTPKWIKDISYNESTGAIVLHTTNSFYSWYRDGLRVYAELEKILPYLIKQLPAAKTISLEDMKYDIKAEKMIKWG